jgi:Ser/Thr protein kinase RdoA (MazF antagonist)
MTIDDYSQLSPDLVIRAVESTGRISDARVMALNSYENRVYQIGIEDEKPVIVKFYRPARWQTAQIIEEHHFCQDLVATELPIVAPLMAQQSTETLFKFEGYRFALFQRKGGQAPEAGDLEQIHRLGMLLGRVHAIGKQQDFIARPRLTIERFLHVPYQCVREGFMPSSLLARYDAVIALLSDKIAALQLNQSVFIRTHGDCHLGNILWTRDDGPWLVDFDDCQSAPAIQDLWMLLTGSRHEQESQLSELLDGYTMFCDFDARELRLIEGLRSLRMIHYAGWLAMRWNDPAFPKYFPWFNTDSYWQQHVAELEQQCRLMDEPPLRWL